MNPYITVLLSMLLQFLKSTLKSAKALLANQKFVALLVEVDVFLHQWIDMAPPKSVAAARKAVTAGKTFAVKLDH